MTAINTPVVPPSSSTADSRRNASAPVTYASLHRNVALLLGGLVLLLAALAGGIAAAFHFAANGDAVLRCVLALLGGFVAAFIALVLVCLRRHRWTVLPTAVVVEERPWLRYTGRRRCTEVAFADIVGLASVQNGTHDLLELATRQGQRFRLGPGAQKPGDHTLGSAMQAWDRHGLTAFATHMRNAMLAAGVACPALAAGMGFWNRPLGLGLLVVLLVLSLGLAIAVLLALWSGATVPRGGQAAGLVLALPFFVGCMLRRAWQRRRAALAASGQV